MKKTILYIIWVFLLFFLGLQTWLLLNTPKVYFNNYSDDCFHQITIITKEKTVKYWMDFEKIFVDGEEVSIMSCKNFLKPVREVKEDFVSLITQKALKHGISPKIALRIAMCESSMKPEAKNKHSSARGLFQITEATEKEAERNLKRDFDAYNPEDNIEMAFYFMKKGQWNRWLCK